jgi:hypothetical protein
MRAYLVTSGTVFLLLVAAHVARAVIEGPGVARDPFFVASTAIAAALFVWALRLLRRPSSL